jgi:hypothetical protein
MSKRRSKEEKLTRDHAIAHTEGPQPKVRLEYVAFSIPSLAPGDIDRDADLEAKVGEKLLVADAMGVPIPQDPVVDESEDVEEAGALPREYTGEPGQRCDTSEGVQIVASSP